MKKVLILLAALTSFLITGCFYNSDKEDMPKSNVTRATTGTITVYYDNPTWFATPNPINIHYNAGNGWTAAPGVAMTKITSQYEYMGGWAVYSIDSSSLTFCFNNGSTWDNNSNKDYKITEPGNYTVKNGVITKL